MPAAARRSGNRPLPNESSTVAGMRARFRLQRFEHGRRRGHAWPMSHKWRRSCHDSRQDALPHFVPRVSEVSGCGRAPRPRGCFDQRPPRQHPRAVSHPSARKGGVSSGVPRHEPAVRLEEASSVHGPGNQPGARPSLSMDSQGPLRGVFRETAPLALAYSPSSTEGLLVAGRITQTSIASSALRSLSRWSESR